MVDFLSLIQKDEAHDLDQLANSPNKRVVVDLVSVVHVLLFVVVVELHLVQRATQISILA
jgi:hypothetical protein